MDAAVAYARYLHSRAAITSCSAVQEEDDLVEALAALSGPTTPEGQLLE